MEVRLRALWQRMLSVALVVALIGVGFGLAVPSPAAAASNRNPNQAGAALPSTTKPSSVPGSKIYVAPNGNDSAPGTAANPLQTLKQAVSKASAGSVIVVRGGVYPAASNVAAITKKLTIMAHPGEQPVFDGSVPAGKPTAEGPLRYVSYRPIPAKRGEGLSLNALPAASFSNGKPTGLAASRGWVCVAGSGTSYSTPGGSGTGCGSGTKPRVITGYYPDQAWVDGKPLVQVHSKGKVVPGTFYVQRSSGSDGAPGTTRLYLSGPDSANMGKVRVSKSTGTMLLVTADGVRIEGLSIVRHSPAWPDSGIRISFGADNATIRNVVLRDIGATALRIMGGDAAGGKQLTKRTTVDRVTIERAQWLGVNATYTDDTSLLNVSITGTNAHNEFVTAPKSGAVKASKTHRMHIIGSDISGNSSHGVWWDQSNYDALLANTRLMKNRDSGVFYEISHGLTMVNNVVVAPNSTNSTPAVRLAGSSGSRLVNNTIVGSQTPLAIAGDARSKTYGSGRLCSEHTQRYRQGGSIGSSCPPGLSSDLDMARPGAYSSKNLTPKLTWKPSITMLVNNVLANPGAGSGGICPGGYPVCVKGYAGSAGKPTAIFKTNTVLQGLQINGNVYQAPSAVAQIRVQQGGSGGVVAKTIGQLRSTLGSGWYGLNAEGNGLAGSGWVSSTGLPTAALAAKQGQAAPVPSDGLINTFLPAGQRTYGSTFAGGSTAATPAPAPEPAPELAPAAAPAPDPVATAEEALASAAPGTYTVRDTFDRTVTGGFGETQTGGTWQVAGAAGDYAVQSGHGVLDVRPGTSRAATLPTATADSATTLTAFRVDGAASGSGAYVNIAPRLRDDGSAYRGKVRIDAAGRVSLGVSKVAADGEVTDLARSDTVLAPEEGRTIMVRVEAAGTSPTTVSARMWLAGQAEPGSWQVQVRDSTAALQAPGGVGIHNYLSASATEPVAVQVDSMVARAR